MDQSTTIVEINGVKMEIDLRHAKVARVETLKVGTKVKVLRKVYDGHAINSGVVIGFDAFEKLPTIRVAFIEVSYSDTPLKFFAFNADTKDAELLIDDSDDISFNRDSIMQSLIRHIETKRIELEKAQSAHDLFLKHFGEILNASVVA